MTPEQVGDALLVAAYGLLWAYRKGRRHSRAELARLRNRQNTYARLLRPVADAMRDGADEIEMRRGDLVALAILAEHPGEDGEQLVELERRIREEQANGPP